MSFFRGWGDVDLKISAASLQCHQLLQCCRMVGKCALKSKHLNNLVAKRFMLSCENITESTYTQRSYVQFLVLQPPVKTLDPQLDRIALMYCQFNPINNVHQVVHVN
ncbi:hypothetical protein T03_7388 [Trichinella britovi]|uniref:Uncharacterized protein n=1 Tax=Trichinella britovi TaxID=45882 RepID=A0A0V1C9S8_TRIBR|nr:hypothetical protein T03_7388 [Trichinella britovi]